MSEDAINQGIELIRSGNIPMGTRILAEIVKQDPQNDTAWAWLSECYTETDRKVYCLNRALRINPGNEIAREGLTRLGETLPAAEESKPQEKPLDVTVPIPRARRESVLSRFESAAISPEELEPPDWSSRGNRPRPARKTRKKTNPLLVVVLIFLVLVLAVVSYLFLPRIFRQVFPEPSHFNENSRAFIQEVDILMAISDGSNNMGAFKAQQALVYQAYDRLQSEWPEDLIYQKNEIDTAMKGWSAAGAIADLSKSSQECKVEGSLLDEVKTYTNSLAIDLTCTEWTMAVMDIAKRHFNLARPGLESYFAR